LVEEKTPRQFVAGGDDAGQRLDLFLAREVGSVSRSQLARQIGEAAVTVNGEVATPSRKLRAGDVVVWAPPPPVPTEVVAEALPLSIVYEDRYLVVVDKPAGMVVHPAPGHEAGTLVNALLAHCSDLRGIGGELRPGIVHRIDKETSGLLVVAKDDSTMLGLAAAFKAHTVERVYDALVGGKPPGPGGRIDTLYGRDPNARKKFSSRVRAGKRAVTNWQVVERYPGAARVEARLETGRTHQVRVHMAALGCSLLADKVYGRAPREPAVRAIAEALGRHALHARALGFVHPASGEKLAFHSPLPADMQAALEALRALGPDR
jgi:23S rRNA pseudouridine1911/1915/1917 synthase